jgi:hypothetical protein
MVGTGCRESWIKRGQSPKVHVRELIHLGTLFQDVGFNPLVRTSEGDPSMLPDDSRRAETRKEHVKWGRKARIVAGGRGVTGKGRPWWRGHCILKAERKVLQARLLLALQQRPGWWGEPELTAALAER